MRSGTGARLAIRLGVVILSCGLLAADWQPDPTIKLERRTAAAVERFERKPRIERFFEEAYGYVVFSTITRIGLGFGGAGGKGLVFEQGRLVGRGRFSQFTSGIQAGVRFFSMIVFFKDEEAMEIFKRARFEFVGQASVTLVTVGASADPAYNSGVAVFTRTKGGLMFEASISGVKFGYTPFDEAEAGGE
jgi:lipid-binding SYLF domain-containing protein